MSSDQSLQSFVRAMLPIPPRRRSSNAYLEGVVKSFETTTSDEHDEGVRPYPRKSSIITTASSSSSFSFSPSSTPSSPRSFSPDDELEDFMFTDPFTTGVVGGEQMSSSSLLPDLPTELILNVLSFCDAPTLATTSLVNMAFLEMSSPLLYGDIVLEGTDQLDLLMCSRDPATHQPQLAPYLSLSQIRTVALQESEWIVRKPFLSRDRLSSSSPFAPRTPSTLSPTTPTTSFDFADQALKVNTFSFAFPPYIAPIVPYGPDFVKDPLKTCIVNLMDQVLHLFDPLNVHLQGFYLQVPARHDAILSVPVVSLNVPWTRLERLEMKNVVSSVPIRECAFAQRDGREEEGEGWGLVLDMRAPSREAFEWLLRYAGADLMGGAGEAAGDEEGGGGDLKRAEVWVDSEERKEEVVEYLRSVGKEGGLGEGVMERRMSRITVEVKSVEAV